MTKQLVFIASGGRTGTQFFGDMLNSVISDCHSEHEPDMVAGISRLTLSRIRRFGLWHMVIGRLLGRNGVRVLGHAFMEGRLDFETCANRLRQSRADYHAGIRQSLVVESYSAWWMFAGQANEIWPGAKVAGILRDPREWIASWQGRRPRQRNGALTDYMPPGPLHPLSMRDLAADRLWRELDQVGRLAWEWSLICRTLDQAAAQSDAVQVFRFEDLFGPGRPALHEFVRFVSDHPTGPRHEIGDLEAIAGDVRNASPRAKRSWQKWSDAQVAAVAHFCGEGMRAHGYGTEPDWLERVARAGALDGATCRSPMHKSPVGNIERYE